MMLDSGRVLVGHGVVKVKVRQAVGGFWDDVLH